MVCYYAKTFFTEYIQWNGFITPPYCQLMRNNGGLLPNPKRQTKLEVCHVVEYSLTAHHLRLCISRKHIALIGHFLHHSLKDSCLQANFPVFFCKYINFILTFQKIRQIIFNFSTICF